MGRKIREHQIYTWTTQTHMHGTDLLEVELKAEDEQAFAGSTM
jgi:hypothetical protein